MSKGANKGSALIAALWTICLLSMLVMSFAYDANLEAKLQVYTRSKRQAEYLIRSAFPIVEHVLNKSSKVTGDETNEQIENDRWIVPAISVKRGEIARIDEPLGQGTIHIEIIPVPGRININAMANANADGVWEQIFAVHGIPQDLWPELIDSFNDWVDADSSPMKSGAEDDYYLSLDPPYKAKNGLLDTVGELGLVKGFTSAILYGGALNPEAPPSKQIMVKGIADLFTVYGESAVSVNVNAASKDVLLAVPGMDESLADAIIAEREGNGSSASSRSTRLRERGASTAAAVEDFSFKSSADVSSRVPGIQSESLAYFGYSSTIYRLIIEGRVGAIVRRVEAIVATKNEELRYLRYREDP